jgi:sugar (pentulose or hexulose) kinase
MEYLLGIDVGTNGTKSVLFTEEGSYVDMAYKGYELLYPREGWVEQRALDWWEALVQTVRTLVKKHNVANRVRALSLSTQGGAAVVLDEEFRPLGNAVSWLDMRAREVQSLIESQISDGELGSICGWDRLYCCNFPVIVWLRERQIGLFKKAAFFASTVDYINQRLTGRFVIDYSNLALTEFLDIQKRDWSDGLLAIAGVERSRLPKILPSGQEIGSLRKEAAGELGLSGKVKVISGAHDQYCASVGAGAVNNGDCVLSSGTAWVLLATSDRLLQDDQGLVHPGIHLMKDRYGMMSAVSSAGDSLNWYQRAFYPNLSLAKLDSKASRVEAGSSGLIFIPKFMASSKKAAFIHVDSIHDSMHFARAVYEGVALANEHHMRAFERIGMAVQKLHMIGGGAKSALWPHIVADVSGVPVEIPEQKEAACAGAAILAGVGSGVFSSIEEAAVHFTGKTERIEPDVEKREVYKQSYEYFVSALENI